MSNKQITVLVLLKPYLQKYLISKSVNKCLPIRFPNKHFYNLLLINLVTNYYSYKQFPLSEKHNCISYLKPPSFSPNEIPIVLPYSCKKDITYYRYLSHKSKLLFSQEVKNDFNLEFSRYLVKNLSKKIPRLDICNNFKDMYDISEDDFKTESLYRYSSRLLKLY